MKASKDKSPTMLPGGGLVPLESILCTEELNRRPKRRPDHETENRALVALAQALADSPQTILQTMAEKMLEVFHCDSAGFSLLTKDEKRFYWAAIAGAWQPHLGGGTPRDFGPCGDVLDRNIPLLFKHWERRYPYLLAATPAAEEGLLVPFYVAGKAVGTIWAIAHDDRRKFDAEDLRQLESLGRFASSAYQAMASLEALEQGSEALRQSRTELAARVAELQKAKAAQDSRRAALNLMEDAVQARGAMETLNVELREKEKALREAEKRKNEFLAMLAHELRNPLAPIRNALHLLQLGNGNRETVQSASAMMERQMAQMVRLVEDLLDVSRISQGKIELRRGRVELASVVNHAIEAASSLCESMNHELTVTLPEQPVYLHGDPMRLAQGIGNLLNNAYKFTERGGRIGLTVEREGEQAVIRVRDTGIGIPAEQLSGIFEMFAQVDTSLERARSGLGIGLTLTKNLVEMHGGTLEAHSAGIGQGSEFVVRLPITTDATTPLPESIVGEPAAATAPHRILVVDDNQDAAASLALLLKLKGHETHVVHDGLQALEAAERFRPEVILLDLGLPQLNGFDAARRIREQPWGKTLTLVAVTGWGQEDDRRKSKDAGFDSHLVKPLDYGALAKLLSSLQSSQAGT